MSKPKSKKVTLAQKAEARAHSIAANAPHVAAYLAGINPVNPLAVESLADVMAVIAPADAAADAALATAASFKGGALALGIVAILVAGQCAETGKGKTLKGAADYVQQNAGIFQGKAGTTQKSVAKLIAESLHFTASNTSDVNTVWLEACAKVREGMATHSSLKAWEKAVRAATGKRNTGEKRQARAEGNAPATEAATEATPEAKPQLGRPPKAKEVTLAEARTGSSLDLIGHAESLFAEIAKRAIENTDATCSDYLAKMATLALEAYEASVKAAERSSQAAKRYRKPAAKKAA